MTTDLSAERVGGLERKHLQHANLRAIAAGTEVAKTHWHIALADGLGWCFAIIPTSERDLFTL